MRKTAFLLAALMALAIPAIASAEDTGTVRVVHGVPGLTVDVYANAAYDAPLLTAFEFGQVAGPLELPAATYEIEIYAAGSDAATTDPALSKSVELPAGASATIVAHLDADGAPLISVLVDDTSTIAAGEGRVTARHLAAAPVVDIWAADSPLFTSVPNGAAGVADVPAGTYPVQIVPAGATEPVVFSADVEIPEGTNVVVHAIGSLDDGSFTVAVFAIDGLHSTPGGVPAGNGGTASAIGLLSLGLGVVGLALLARSRKPVTN
jgi:hypothetical protein